MYCGIELFLNVRYDRCLVSSLISWGISDGHKLCSTTAKQTLGSTKGHTQKLEVILPWEPPDSFAASLLTALQLLYCCLLCQMVALELKSRLNQTSEHHFLKPYSFFGRIHHIRGFLAVSCLKLQNFVPWVLNQSGFFRFLKFYCFGWKKTFFKNQSYLNYMNL